MSSVESEPSSDDDLPPPVWKPKNWWGGDGQKKWEVADIVGFREVHEMGEIVPEYRIRWKDYDWQDDTWQSENAELRSVKVWQEYELRRRRKTWSKRVVRQFMREQGPVAAHNYNVAVGALHGHFAMHWMPFYDQLVMSYFGKFGDERELQEKRREREEKIEQLKVNECSKKRKFKRQRKRRDSKKENKKKRNDRKEWKKEKTPPPPRTHCLWFGSEMGCAASGLCIWRHDSKQQCPPCTEYQKGYCAMGRVCKFRHVKVVIDESVCCVCCEGLLN